MLAWRSLFKLQAISRTEPANVAYGPRAQVTIETFANRRPMLMIAHYSDHAANERTFLAWVRTAIATMAFGFLVERFDLFIRFASREVGSDNAPHARNAADWAGLALVLMGIAMVALAAYRYWRTAKQIDSDATTPGPGVRFDLALAMMLVLLGCSLLIYLPHAAG